MSGYAPERYREKPAAICTVGQISSESVIPYERNEARYILQLPKNYDTISINFGIDKNEMKLLVIALAELDLTIDEWLGTI